MNSKKLVSIILIALILLPSFNNISYAEKPLNLKGAISVAQKKSDSLNLVKLDLIKKSVERRQAIDGLRDIREKQTTVRFSLLFSIKFPESHGMPKEIELLMKLPKIDNDIKKLNEKYKFEVNKLVFDVKSAYYEVLDKEAVLKHETKNNRDLNNTYKKIYKSYLNGTANKEDVDLIDAALKKSTDNLTKANLAFEASKAKLSKVIGMNVTKGYVFKNELVDIKLSRSDLEFLINYGLSNDYQLFSATSDRKLAEKEVHEVYEIYKSYYGSKVNIIAQEINKDKIDYVALHQKYEQMLQNIDAKWQKVYVINMLFFKIRIPMRWFQGEYTALRYFENEKYPLIVALGERDKARVAEQVMRDLTIQKITDSYEAVKQMELVIIQTREGIERTKKSYEQLRKDNLSGKVSFAEVEQVKEELKALELAEFQARVSLSKFIAALDFNTSGAVIKLSSSADFASGDYESGISNIERDFKKDEMFWYIETPFDSFKFIFGVNIPTDLQATHYRLFDASGMPVGSLTQVKDTIEHLPLTLDSSSNLRVIFYSNNKEAYMANIEGDGFYGKLELIEIKSAMGELEAPVGAYEIKESDFLRGSLAITIKNDYDYEYFQIFDLDGVAITDAFAKGQPLEAFKFILKDASQYNVVLFEKGEIKLKLKLLPESEGAQKGVLILNP